jgi:hypothetical protein
MLLLVKHQTFKAKTAFFDKNRTWRNSSALGLAMTHRGRFFSTEQIYN